MKAIVEHQIAEPAGKALGESGTEPAGLSPTTDACLTGITVKQTDIKNKKVEIIEPDFIYSVHEI